MVHENRFEMNYNYNKANELNFIGIRVKSIRQTQIATTTAAATTNISNGTEPNINIYVFSRWKVTPSPQLLLYSTISNTVTFAFKCLQIIFYDRNYSYYPGSLSVHSLSHTSPPPPPAVPPTARTYRLYANIENIFSLFRFILRAPSNILLVVYCHVNRQRESKPHDETKSIRLCMPYILYICVCVCVLCAESIITPYFARAQFHCLDYDFILQ